MDAPSAELTARARARAAPAWVGLLWVAAAFLSAVCGIGGGLFAVPVLHYLCGLDMKRAVGTSLLLVFALSTTGTLVELLHADSALDGPTVALLVVGGYLGARTGFALSRRIDALWLKRVFALVLVVSAVRILGLDARAAATGGIGLQGLSTAQMGIVLLVGFGGGFVAPLLGVGGGLVVIPALLLSLQDVSYLQARACSTALSVFTSSQSAALHWRAGNVDRRLAWRFALLTVLGSVVGVLAVHQPGWSGAARSAMALILLFVAGRFAWDVLRARRQRAQA